MTCSARLPGQWSSTHWQSQGFLLGNLSAINNIRMHQERDAMSLTTVLKQTSEDDAGVHLE